MSIRETVISGAAALGVALPDGAAEKLAEYYRLLEEKNRVMNLTAISGEDETARLHFLDSLALLAVCDFSDASVIDVGTGAGLPGLPIAAASPKARVTLLDSLGKRVDFLTEVCAALSLRCECVHARAEEESRISGRRDGYDIAVSRAVARLSELCELCMPFVKPGGVFIAMKAQGADEEIAEAKSAIKKLGGLPPVVREYTIPGTDIVRCAVVIPKDKPTPDEYPRRFAKIHKSPL